VVPDQQVRPMETWAHLMFVNDIINFHHNYFWVRTIKYKTDVPCRIGLHLNEAAHPCKPDLLNPIQSSFSYSRMSEEKDVIIVDNWINGKVRIRNTFFFHQTLDRFVATWPRTNSFVRQIINSHKSSKLHINTAQASTQSEHTKHTQTLAPNCSQARTIRSAWPPPHSPPLL
jgi:hypothetical protein